jgi:SAM-dependent methyltransferase
MNLHEFLGPIDIYFFDQILRGRITPGMRIVDAGCGSGRNLVYLMREGYEIYANDTDPNAVETVRRLAAAVAPALPAANFKVEPVETMSLPDDFADVVISSAVLHFARNDEHFHAMVRSMWRVLRPGGMMFSRLASSIGIEHQVVPVRGRRFRLPDTTERYLVDEEMLAALTRDLGAEMLDPLKTTLVHRQRSMTTWVIAKVERS